MDFDKKYVYSIFHAITKRYIWIQDGRGDHYVELKRGNILVMHGRCCHAGAKNESKRISYAMHVPVKLPIGSTFACGHVKLKNQK